MKQTGTLHPNNLGMIDFSSSHLNLGAKIPGKKVGWTELDYTDWKILRALLSRQVWMGRSASSESDGLKKLLEFAEAIVEWYESPAGLEYQ